MSVALAIEGPATVDTAGASYSVGPLELFPDERRVIGPRGELRLTAHLFAVTSRLMRRPGTIVSRSELISAIYADANEKPEHVEAILRNYILKLRNTIELLGCPGTVVIITEPGIGYGIRAVWRSDRVEGARIEGAA
jgi:DNA-binding response OmpR family regulator